MTSSSPAPAATAAPADGRAPAVRVEGLTKRFGHLLALDDLDLTLERGEVFGFLGPNGAGKTTTLRLLMGFLRPTAGRATLFGLDAWRDAAQVHARIGYLPGDLAFPRRDTARELLGWLRRVGRPTTGHPARHEVEGLARRLDLELDRPLHELSKGNRQKVGLVAAFADDPELLLLDEPTAGLDPLVQQEFQRMVREVVEDGRSVLLSSHVLSEVQQVADRVGILRQGRLLVVESMETMRDKAAHRVSARLAAPVDVAEFVALPGLDDVRADGDWVFATVHGEPDAFVKALARHHVLDLNSHEADLEETFLAYYGDTGGDRVPEQAASREQPALPEGAASSVQAASR